MFSDCFWKVIPALGRDSGTPQSLVKKGAASSVKSFLSAGILLAEARAVILVVSRRELSGWHVRDVSACDAVGKAELGFRSVLCKWSLADVSIMSGLGAPCFQDMRVTVYSPCR